jgi:hypothetical protein
MAYVIPRDRGWELRQSHATEDGPRSRTLASFRVLDAAAIERATERARPALSPAEIVRAARRAGAPVALDEATTAGQRLLAELAAGRGPAAGIRRALAAALGLGELSAAERAAVEWIGRSEAERGAALRDLLLLADAVPPRTGSDRPLPPRIASGAA